MEPRIAGDEARSGPGQGAIEASPPLGVWQLAWPSMALFALHALVGLVDFVFVSSLGTEAVAAVGVANQIHFFVFAVLGTVTTGTLAVVARVWGAGDRDEAGRAARASIAATGLLADYLVRATLLCWRFASGRWQQLRV